MKESFLREIGPQVACEEQERINYTGSYPSKLNFYLQKKSDQNRFTNPKFTFQVNKSEGVQ